jgi:translation initiation factor IF-2
MGDIIVAGTTYARVRRMTTSAGKSIKQARPGTTVEVTGWKERPNAGNMVLQADTESVAKSVVRNRLNKRNQERDLENVESLNQQRIVQRDAQRKERERRMVAEEIKRNGQSLPGMLVEPEEGSRVKSLKVVIKADVDGSMEAVEDAIRELGNSEVKVDIVGASVGEITETDLITAAGLEGYMHVLCANAAILIGFCIRGLNPTLRTAANRNNVEIIHHSIIYKVIDDVIARLEKKLTPKLEIKVVGEAKVVTIFNINIQGAKTKPVGGCKVSNGTIFLKEKCRVTRNGKIVYSGGTPTVTTTNVGSLDTLRHFKENVTEAHKGMECGLLFGDYDDIRIGDLIQSYKEFEVKRKLYG